MYNKIRKRYVDLEIEGSGPKAADQKSSDVRFTALEFEMTPRWGITSMSQADGPGEKTR